MVEYLVVILVICDYLVTMYVVLVLMYFFNFLSSLPSELFYCHLWPHLRVIRGWEGGDDLHRGQTGGRLCLILPDGADQQILLPRAGLRHQASLTRGPGVCGLLSDLRE